MYLHPKDATARPMMSHYASSHNVLFKITVPKRTGRKRKRGSNEPWQGEVEEISQQDPQTSSATLRSQAKLDETKILRRKLQDNADRYRAEAVGVIKHTHRYRGMVDFNYTMQNNEFMNNFTNTILSGDSECSRSCPSSCGASYSHMLAVSKFRTFSIRPGTDCTPGQEIIAPPLMTQITIPYYYHYSQNPYVRAMNTDDGGYEMVNTTAKVQSVGYFIGIRDPIPAAPTGRPPVRDPLFDDVVRAMKICMEERPVWTRRSIINRLVTLDFDPANPGRRIPSNPSQQIVKNAIQFAGYQFKGGPWRDALVRYGYDPRTDPSSRKYQCLIFRLRRLEVGQMGEMWQDIRKRDLAGIKGTMDEFTDSHIFDGKTYKDDGKVWQVCDITDPLLARLLADAPLRPQCDLEGSGWYHRGLWAKVRAIMKCKMRAIQFGRVLTDADFRPALEARDATPDLETTRSIAVPTPDLKLTDAEWEQVRGKRYKGTGRQRKNKRASYHFPSNRPAKKLRRSRAAASEDNESDREEQDPDQSRQIDGVENGDIMETVEDAHRVASRVRLASDDDEDEDGSEYDEFDGDEDDGDVNGESDEQDQELEDPDLAEHLRLSRYDFTDNEQGEDQDDEQEDEDEEQVDEEDEDQDGGESDR